MDKEQSEKNHNSLTTLIILAVILCVSVGMELWVIHRVQSSSEPEDLITDKDQQERDVTPIIASMHDRATTVAKEYQELFSNYYGQAEALLQSMTLNEKIGQLFLVRFHDDGAMEEIKNDHPGGYILFGKDFANETKGSILEKLQRLQNASKLGLILAVDEEGGSVVRVSAYPEFRADRFASPRTIYDSGQLPAILTDSAEKSALLKSIGLNMNLAPVADISIDPMAFMYDRSLGQDAQTTAAYVSQLIRAMNDDGMISVMKHFPGYGDNADTHTGIAVDERSYETFQTADFLPFISGIQADAPCILVSHTIVTSMDPNHPASLSKQVHNILRENLHFSGIIMTDDLNMDAVKTYVDNGEAAVQAILAGNDMIITSDFQANKKEILNAVNEGRISEAQIDQAVKRLLAWKYSYHIIE